jgi:hypothetical protein
LPIASEGLFGSGVSVGGGVIVGVAVGEGGTGVSVSVGIGVSVGVEIDIGAQETRMIARVTMSNILDFMFLRGQTPNGLRYPRWGGRRNAVRLEKC